MRVAAVLIAQALCALAPKKVDGFERANEIAGTMSRATAKMAAGLEHFLKETEEAKADRAQAAAHAFVDGGRKRITEEDLDAMEQKAEHLAQQMLRNIKALSSAAEALQQQVHGLPRPEAPRSEAGEEGYTARLENQVAALRKTIEETEQEKQSLVSSVATLMHNGAAAQMKQELASAKERIVQLEDGAKEEVNKATQSAEQLRSDNAVCTEALSTCQAEQKAQQTGQVQESMVESTVKCKKELADATKRLNSVESEHNNMVQTVQMMVKSSDELKAKLAAAQECKTASPAAAPAAPTIDIAHMAETAKMDQYIAQSLPSEEPAPAAPRVQPAKAKANATQPEEKLEMVESKHLQAATREASKALAGEGEIGKYLRGTSKSGKAEEQDLEVQIDSLMPEDEVLPAPKQRAAPKAAPQEDLAQKLLLQAEQNLKLAN